MAALLLALFAIIAFLYTAVGQAGGTGYIAVMGLLGYSHSVIKPTALALRCIRYYRAGLMTWRTCYPFAVLGAPFSLVGGAINLSAKVYQPVVGVLLLIAAGLMFRSARTARNDDLTAPHEPPFGASLLTGGAIGFVSGITGVGGGIFLAPVILTFRWAETRQASAISSMFNLMNSAVALAGMWATIRAFPSTLPLWLIAAGAGALLGSWIGAYRLPPQVLRIVLGVLLLAAGLRMTVASRSEPSRPAQGHQCILELLEIG
jgi:uncharacterized protein